MAKELIISCPDRRVHEEVDRKHSGIHVKLAGGNVATSIEPLAELIRKEHITKVTDLLHTDCGAMGAVFEDISLVDTMHPEKSKYSQAVHKFLINPYRVTDDKVKAWGKDRSVLEHETNVEVQKRAFRKIAERVDWPLSINIEVIETDALGAPKFEHGDCTLLILRPSELNTNEVIEKLGLVKFATYVEQPPAFEKALGDVELFIRNMGLHKVVFGITSSSEKEQVLKDKALFEATFPGVEARIAEL